MTPAVLVVRGARSCEATLLGQIARLGLDAFGHEALAPIRIVVPSRALRQHVQARLVATTSQLGVGVQTLRGLAAEIVERAGARLPGGDAFLEVMVMRAAASRPALARVLAGLDDGWRSLAGTVCDLLDAGLTAAHLEAVRERLAEMATDDPAVERARAVVDVASAVESQATHLGIGGAFALWREAAAFLDRDGPALLPARAVLVYGFADATGLALDLIEALVKRLDAQVIVDGPDDAAAGPSETSWEFSRRLRERLAGWRGEDRGLGAPATAPTLCLVRAAGVAGEVRAALSTIRSLLDRGVAPESIGLVGRQLATYEATLAVQARQLGVPVAVQGGVGLAGPLRRQLAALAALLRRGDKAPVETWRAVQGQAADDGDTLLALRLLGVRTVEDAAGLDLGAVLGSQASIGLPVRTGLTVDTDEGGPGWIAPRRRLSRRLLEEVVASARRLSRALQPPPAAPLAHQLGHLHGLLEGSLDLGDAAREVVGRVCEDLAASLPADLDLEWAEVVLLVRRALEEAGRETTGGAGAGVQVMGVTQGRGLTFAHLFVLGLNRDVFPRVVKEDPLLPDWVRSALVPLLPDLSVKARGHDEERFLFAQLLAAAPAVTLSWQGSDDDGHELSPSPLVERLLLARPELKVAEPTWEDGRTVGQVAAALDHAVAAGLSASRDLWEGVLALVMAATDETIGHRAAARAAVRRRVLDEVDPDFTQAEGRRLASAPGPYLGLIGASPGGELEGRLWVTALEALARCPWQTFLRRLLRLEPGPDPEAELLGVDPRLVGSVVHAVLADVAGGGDAPGPASWGAAIAGTTAHHRWPVGDELDTLLARRLQGLAREIGGLPPGLARALALHARPWLEVARTQDWMGAGPAVLGVEVEGHVTVLDVEGRPRDVRFKADRVDRRAGGEVWVTDYKTGKPVSAARTPATRRKHLLQGIRRGGFLQATAYARAVEAGGGRYLFLKPDLDDELREAVVDQADEEISAGFAAVMATLLAAWDGGVFLPRLTDPAGHRNGPGCGSCELSSACSLHDTTTRRRLLAWVEGSDSGVGSEVARAIWALPLAQAGEGGRE